MVVLAVEPETYFDVYSSEFGLPAGQRKAFIRDAQRWWSATSSRQMGLEGRRPRSDPEQHLPARRTAARSWDFTIAASSRARPSTIDTNFMLFQYDYFDETRSFGKDTIGWLMLHTPRPRSTIRSARPSMRCSPIGLETSTDTEKAFNKAFAAQLGNIALIVELVVGAAFATILMIVGNSMIMAVRERTREIGVLKTLGFTGARMLRLVLGESVLLALLGGIPGLLVALITWGCATACRISSRDDAHARHRARRVR